MTISPTGSIVMIVVLSILALLFITELTKTLRKRPSRISPTAIIFLMVSSVLLVYLFYAGQDMGLVDYSQILLMLGLVAITSLYATSTEKQAKASIEMAEEMRQQRNDMVRPVIDIERDTWNDDMISEALTISDNNTSLGLHFKLSNVGIGPALDVETITQFGDRRQLQSLGTIAKDGEIPHWSLSLEQPDGRTAVVVSYGDVYSRRFESSREIGKDGEKGLQIKALKITLVVEGKKHD